MALVLASPAQLRARLQDPSLDDATAAQAIADASALVRAVARQTFDFVKGDVVELVGGERDLVLPERPVVVDAANPLTVVELDFRGSAAITATEGIHFHRVGNVLRRRWRSQWTPAMQYPIAVGLPYASPPYPTGVWAPTVRVTYSHGYAVAPDWLTTITLDVAAQYAINPMMLRTETVGGVTLTWASESMRAPVEMVDHLRTQLAAVGIRRRGAFSVRTG